jgi:DNA mismatch endonuclease (patch repair protein)
VFIHGCFWHGHEGCSRHRIPKTHTDYWAAKISRNKERDACTAAALRAMGWTVLVLWECEIKRPEHLSALLTAIKSG